MGEQLKTITEPQVRFRGFTDEWEQVKVADIFNVTRGKVLSKDLVSVDKSDDNIYPVYSSQTSNDGLMGYYNEYLFDKAITWTTDGANAGTVNYRGAKFYSTNVNGVLLSDEGYVNQCVAEILNKIAWKYVSKVGNPKLMNNIMSDIPITIPHIEEQQKIGDLFQTLDALIGSSNEQVENLNQQKKALLQRLFPQKGETVPQVRLDGFSDAWEEVKLGDVLEKGNKNRVDDPNDYNRLTVKLNKKGLEEFESERELANTRPFYQRFKGEIIIGKQNYFNGSIAVVTDEFDGFVSSNAIMSFPVKNDMATTAFIYFLISQDNFIKQREHFANGTGQKELSESDFLNFKLNLPSLEEQQKIGELFQTLDEQICHVENKASRYNELKQALLQRMFV